MTKLSPHDKSAVIALTMVLEPERLPLHFTLRALHEDGTSFFKEKHFLSLCQKFLWCESRSKSQG
ncbi:hypothetical protein, partial [Nocardioides malaquae]|uniref:hypothetical protein n=1 Tax=Nocardioides malaquae TaxID=2773426 RepID=UPI001D0D1A4D